MSHKNHSRRGSKDWRKKHQPFWKNRWIIGSVIAVVLIAGIAIYEIAVKEDFVPQVMGAPSIQVANAVVHHGDVQLNSFVEAKYEIRNVGDQELRIINQPIAEVIEGCCPPDVEISDRHLSPGETATISMNYMMHEGMGGPHELQIRLVTNDPQNQEVILTAFSNWIE
jgi:hypothetical protein